MLIEIGRTLQLEGGSGPATRIANDVGTEVVAIGTETVAGYAATAGVPRRFVDSAISFVTKRAPALRPLTLGQRQARISKALWDSNSLLIVALDDLERLPSDRIQEVFRVVSAIASFSNTVYILSMDRHRAADALTEVFDDGHAYLEKFLNLTFDLPHPDPDAIRALLVKQLNGILERHEFPADLDVDRVFDHVWTVGLGNLFQTPRDVVRS